jgi:DNA recombination protein RmuC
VMQRKLKGVDELPEKDAIELLGLNDGKVDPLDDDDTPANT